MSGFGHKIEMVKYTQTNRQLLVTNCLGVFDDFVGLTIQALNLVKHFPTKTFIILFF